MPVEAVMTPLSFSSGLRFEMRLMPPLILNTPVGWTFSCFTYASKPSIRDSEGWWRRGVLLR
ncbi:hypothetical protein ES703_16604 [subsurface metagenome]